MIPRYKYLEHRKSAKVEGRSIILTGCLTLTGMTAFVLALVSWTSADRMFIILFVFIGVVIFGTLCWSAALHLKSEEDFVCRIDDDEVVCISPSLNGPEFLKKVESFSIRLKDIARLEDEHDTECSGRSRWYIWTTSGQRFLLTSNYDNPVKKFVEAIRKRIPDIEVIKT